MLITWLELSYIERTVLKLGLLSESLVETDQGQDQGQDQEPQVLGILIKHLMCSKSQGSYYNK